MIKGAVVVRITVLFGSPRPDGFTAALLREFLTDYPDAEVTRFDAYELNLLPCVACDRCREDGRCAFRDADDLFAACETCDLLVLASPVYNYGFPSPMKAVLDRAQPWYHRNFERGEADPARKGVLLLTAGRSGKYAFELMEKQFRVFCRELGVTFAETRARPGTDQF